MTKEDYNNEPIHYCSNCLAINAKVLDDIEDIYMCQDCGNTDILETDVDTWNHMYVELYGKAFLDIDVVVEDEE